MLFNSDRSGQQIPHDHDAGLNLIGIVSYRLAVQSHWDKIKMDVFQGKSNTITSKVIAPILESQEENKIYALIFSCCFSM
jgi:hypothetical protein